MRLDEELDHDDIVQQPCELALGSAPWRVALHEDVDQHLKCAIDHTVIDGAIGSLLVRISVVLLMRREPRDRLARVHQYVHPEEEEVVCDNA